MFGWKIVRYGSLESTNSTLKELAQKGAGHGTVVVSTVQTQGKGRMTRKWESPEGGLWMSVLLETSESFENNKFGIIPLMSGSAVATAIMNIYNMDVGVKWPNDVLMGGRKACGILGELLNVDGKQYVIVGIGINVNNPVQKGYEFSEMSTSLVEERGRESKLYEIERAVLQEMGHRIRLLKEGKYSEIIEEWKELSETLGRQVRIIAPNEELTGLAKDIDENGMLIIELEDGTLKTINVGDCQHLD